MAFASEIIQITKVHESCDDLFWGNLRELLSLTICSSNPQQGLKPKCRSRRGKCVHPLVTAVDSPASAEGMMVPYDVLGCDLPGSHAQLLWAIAQQRGELTPSAVLTKSSGSWSSKRSVLADSERD